MSDPLETAHLGLPYLAPAQAQKHVTHNEALRRLDAVVQLAVLDSTLAAPPGSPAEGDRYIVATGGTGAWAGHDGEIAVFVDGAWDFALPEDGWIAYDRDAAAVLVREAGGWVAASGHLGGFDRLGVNAAAVDPNRLAVRSNAVLFTGIEAADGGTGDVRFVVNKEADADTASLLFQSGWSGRAEIGLAGDTDLVVKVSPDGSAWTEAIRVDKDTGVPAILYDNAVSGLTAATVQDAIDELAASGGGAVASVFGRTGTVAAAAGDYDAAEVDFTPTGGLAATNVQAALAELDSEKAAAASLAAVAVSGAYADLSGRPAAEAGFRNLLINPHGFVNQRAAASNADDTYGHDRWVALAQTGAIAVSTLVNVEDGTPAMMRLTQSQATAQRMGYAQIIEGRSCRHLRGRSAVLSGRIRFSSNAAVRYAILEWTGTEDAVTSDVVNNWASGTYTAGNFFLASNLVVRAVGAITPAAATLADLTALSATLGSTFTNLIVMIWTEGTAAQTATLDLALQLERGTIATEREFRPIGVEEDLCKRTFQRVALVDGKYIGGGVTTSTAWATASFSIGSMRAAPIASYSDLTHVKVQVSGGGWVTGPAALAINTSAEGLSSLSFNKASAFTANTVALMFGAGTGYLDFDAEL
jgi:hypothetical protein